MQLYGDIKINEYTAIPKKISEKELSQKKTLLALSIFQDEIEYAIIDLDNNYVYASGIYSSQEKKISAHELTFLINDFVNRYHLQQIKFKNINILYASPHFTFCPTEFYLPEKKHLLLHHTHPINPNETTHTNEFENIKIIYSIPKNIHNELLQLFPSAKILHTSASVLHLFFYHPLLLHSKIWIHLHPNYIEIISKNNQQFLFYNTFDIQTSLDILYYTLFCMEQNNFDIKNTNLHLSGNISTQHSIFQLLSKYTHNLQLLHHHPKLHILPLHSPLTSHHHFITLNHHLCASYQENTKAEK